MTKKTNSLSRYWLRSDALQQRWKDLHELERQAGIGHAADKAREGPLFPRGAFSDAPFGSDEWQQIREEEDADNERYTRYGIRRAYFSVADIDQRKALIEGQREIHSAWQEMVREGVVEAEGKLTAAKNRGGASAHAWAAFSGAGYVVIGWAVFGLVGAIGGAVAAYFLGQQKIEEAGRRRQKAVAGAEAELKDANEGCKKVLNTAPIFTRSEARTGQAEKDSANA